MKGYVIFYVDAVHDRARLKAYQAAGGPTLAEFGGKVIIAYGEQEPVEGPPMFGVVTIEFPTYQAAQGWYHSEGYQAAKAIRETAATCRAVIVAGKA